MHWRGGGGGGGESEGEGALRLQQDLESEPAVHVYYICSIKFNDAHAQ